MPARRDAGYACQSALPTSHRTTTSVGRDGDRRELAVRERPGARVMSYELELLIASDTLVTLFEDHEPQPVPGDIVYSDLREVLLKLRALLESD